MNRMGMVELRAGGVRTTIRRLAVSAGTALAVVLVGSRVNRPGPVSWSQPEGPRVADEVLAEVRLDVSSLRDGVESINRAAGRPRVRLETAGSSAHDWVVRDVGPAPGPWRNVRLGSVLAIAVQRIWGPGVFEWREEDGAIVLSEPGSMNQRAECRAYDLRDLVEARRAWSDGLPTGEPRAPRRPRVFCFGSEVELSFEQQVAALVGATGPVGAWDGADGRDWVVEGWGGHLFVRASPAGHRQVERLLMLLRLGDSGAVRASGGEP